MEIPLNDEEHEVLGTSCFEQSKPVSVKNSNVSESRNSERYPDDNRIRVPSYYNWEKSEWDV